MFSKKAVISQSLRHPRISYVVGKSFDFQADIWMEKNGKKANAKDLMDTLKLDVNANDEITIIADGTDEVQAVEILADIAENDYRKYFPDAE